MPHGVNYIEAENGGALLLPDSIRKRPVKWDRRSLRDAGLLPVDQEWFQLLRDAGVPMVAGAYMSDRDLPMPDTAPADHGTARGLQSGWWAEAWVFLALNTWGKRSKAGMRRWIRELLLCEKQRVVIVTEAIMMAKSKRVTWLEPAKIWLDQQRTCANTCPYMG